SPRDVLPNTRGLFAAFPREQFFMPAVWLLKKSGGANGCSRFCPTPASAISRRSCGLEMQVPAPCVSLTPRSLDEVFSADLTEAVCAEVSGYLITPPRGGLFRMVEASPLRGPIPADVVLDMVYNPPITRLLRSALDQGKTAIQGTTMFLAQAARQFEIWTGHRAPSKIFEEKTELS